MRTTTRIDGTEQADGTWTFAPQGGGEKFVVELDQTFQKVKGTANSKPLTDAKLNGAQLDLAFVGDRGTSQLKGTVNNGRIEATVTDSNNKQTRYIGTRS